MRLVLLVYLVEIRQTNQRPRGLALGLSFLYGFLEYVLKVVDALPVLISKPCHAPELIRREIFCRQAERGEQLIQVFIGR